MVVCFSDFKDCVIVILHAVGLGLMPTTTSLAGLPMLGEGLGGPFYVPEATRPVTAISSSIITSMSNAGIALEGRVSSVLSGAIHVRSRERNMHGMVSLQFKVL